MAMEYRHTVRFVPTGETPRSASETRTEKIYAEQQVPSDATVTDARNAFRQQVSDYAARNHWEAYDILTAAVNPPWPSPGVVRGTLESNCDWIDHIKTVRKGREQYLIIHHDETLLQHEVATLLEDQYGSPTGFLLRPSSPSKKRLFSRWETSLAEETQQ